MKLTIFIPANGNGLAAGTKHESRFIEPWSFDEALRLSYKSGTRKSDLDLDTGFRP